LLKKLRGTSEYEEAIQKISERKDDPYSVAERLIARFLTDQRE